MKLFATKSGSKVHREECRFAKGAVEVTSSGKRGFCAICKPHNPAFRMPVKADKVHSACKVCKPGDRDASHVVTPTGGCYHVAGCRTLSRKPKASAAKAPAKIAPTKVDRKKAMKSVLASL